jgi:hypothetical protein
MPQKDEIYFYGFLLKDRIWYLDSGPPKMFLDLLQRYKVKKNFSLMILYLYVPAEAHGMPGKAVGSGSQDPGARRGRLA